MEGTIASASEALNLQNGDKKASLVATNVAATNGNGSSSATNGHSKSIIQQEVIFIDSDEEIHGKAAEKDHNTATPDKALSGNTQEKTNTSEQFAVDNKRIAKPRAKRRSSDQQVIEGDYETFASRLLAPPLSQSSALSQLTTNTPDPKRQSSHKSSANRGKSSTKSRSSSSKKRRRNNNWSKPTRRTKQNVGSPKLVAAADGDDYWEAERIVDKRKRKNGKMEYLIRWKNCLPKDDTWEPEENLCDSLFEEALQLEHDANAKKLGLIEDEENSVVLGKKSFDEEEEKNNSNSNNAIASVSTSPANSDKNIAPASTINVPQSSTASKPVSATKPVSTTTANSDPQLKPNTAEDPIDWTDQGQITYREITRINVNDEHVKERVDEARLSGVPVVLTGHKGWAQFAKGWLKSTDGSFEDDTELLDLSKPHEINMEQMLKDIGNESVPIIRRNYDEHNPIQGSVPFSTYVEKCWGNTEETSKRKSRLYLHQWQFPLSDTAAEKLCGKGKNTALPKGILGIDLFKYWLDTLDDSPYQYIFMGTENTLSNMHKDSGGLMISIAPLVGKKEVVLVHRSDGPGALYHLQADLQKPDLHQFPLMASARVWRSVIKPGEILIMPQGTYHQCRNITPCLSYHRFFLDVLNLKPFFESFLDRDAPELDHSEVLWNSCVELRYILDQFTDAAENNQTPRTSYTEALEIVKSLRALRNISREMSRRSRKSSNTSSYDSSAWEKMVHDLDGTLHDFRYRNHVKKPLFRKKKSAFDSVHESVRRSADDDKLMSDDESTAEGKHTHLYTGLKRCKKLSPEEEGLTVTDNVVINVGDTVYIRIADRKVKSIVTKIENPMKAVFVKYESLPSCHDEFRPLCDLRVPVSGESSVELGERELRKGMVVSHCERGEHYRGFVKYWRTSTFYNVQLPIKSEKFDNDRWILRDSIISVENNNGSSSLDVLQRMSHDSTSSRKTISQDTKNSFFGLSGVSQQTPLQQQTQQRMSKDQSILASVTSPITKLSISVLAQEVPRDTNGDVAKKTTMAPSSSVLVTGVESKRSQPSHTVTDNKSKAVRTQQQQALPHQQQPPTNQRQPVRSFEEAISILNQNVERMHATHYY